MTSTNKSYLDETLPHLAHEDMRRRGRYDDQVPHMQGRTSPIPFPHRDASGQPNPANYHQRGNYHWQRYYYGEASNWYHYPHPAGSYPPAYRHQGTARSPNPYYSSEPKSQQSSETLALPHCNNYSSSSPPSKVTPHRSPSCGTLTKNRTSPNPAGGYIWEVHPHDILCGRGAPTHFHEGNQRFRDLVKEYQTIYLCSKRSDKPQIATELMSVVQSRGGRFLRRVKTSGTGRFAWEEIGELRAYEKVCQALREGAPEIRRKMIAHSKMEDKCRNKENLQGSGNRSDEGNDSSHSHRRRW